MTQALTLEDADRIIDPIVEFPEINAAFQRIRSITNFRKDDSEARVLYLCRRIPPNAPDAGGTGAQSDEEDLYVLKCKVQYVSLPSIRPKALPLTAGKRAPSALAGGLTTPVEGPNEHTLDEIKALRVFKDVKAPSLPHLVTWKKAVQGDGGLMPGGYISYVVMTLMPGQDLLEARFWSMSEDQQDEIRVAFVEAIKSIWTMGFQPYDCALRNILWQAETKTLSIVDFEHWTPATKDPINMNEREEMTRWGILKRPLPQYHWQVWREAATLSGHEQTWY